MKHFDVKDRKILYALDINSRQSYHDLAKKVGLSKDAVIYRIKKLQEEGIIQHFHAVIDSGKLGFISFRLYLKLQNTTPEKEEEILAFLAKKNIITWLGSFEGEYDLAMWIPVKTVDEMDLLWNDIMNTYRDNIERKWLTIFNKVSYYPRNYLINKDENYQEYVFISKSQDQNIDEKDQAILRQLTQNARIPILEIAKKVDLLPQTVTMRIKNLEKKKVIVGYRTMFNIEKLGYQYYKVHINLHNANNEIETQLRRFIKNNPYIIYDNYVLGGDDIEIDVQTPSMEILHQVLDEIKRRFVGIIRNYKYMTIRKEHKYNFLPI